MGKPQTKDGKEQALHEEMKEIAGQRERYNHSPMDEVGESGHL